MMNREIKCGASFDASAEGMQMNKRVCRSGEARRVVGLERRPPGPEIVTVRRPTYNQRRLRPGERQSAHAPSGGIPAK